VYKRGTNGGVDPPQDGWYYLTMSNRVTGTPLDDPTLYRIGTFESICSTGC
jgi:hypothetical protein